MCLLVVWPSVGHLNKRFICHDCLTKSAGLAVVSPPIDHILPSGMPRLRAIGVVGEEPSGGTKEHCLESASRFRRNALEKQGIKVT